MDVDMVYKVGFLNCVVLLNQLKDEVIFFVSCLL